MKFSCNIESFLALTSVATVVAASSQQEVQHRLRGCGGVPASSSAKTVKERRLGWESGPEDGMDDGAESDLATNMNAITSISSDMDDMDLASNITDSASASADSTDTTSADTTSDASTDDAASASDSEDTTVASTSSGDCTSISKSSLVTFIQHIVQLYTRTILPISVLVLVVIITFGTTDITIFIHTDNFFTAF